ncbi:hypothetical protein BCR44DRAFT_1440493 [Catenaria anguillulae PL171]|uniref:Uncharacterized protein n=1 Tax=Catenaria anguillulae PL171 TaxID=765915 RepID=A0A1Y2HCH8_9FUNG|nr:hypothetical protein BCR44DRAFT_1440493 [Catenaria anguillulae PL171]
MNPTVPGLPLSLNGLDGDLDPRIQLMVVFDPVQKLEVTLDTLICKLALFGKLCKLG